MLLPVWHNLTNQFLLFEAFPSSDKIHPNDSPPFPPFEFQSFLLVRWSDFLLGNGDTVSIYRVVFSNRTAGPYLSQNEYNQLLKPEP